MSIVQSNSSFNSSLTSSLYDSQDDVHPAKIKNYVKEILKSRIFLGRYIERRLADKRIGYRDVILVSAAEVELIRDLTEAQQQLIIACASTKPWIGITDTEPLGIHTSGICLWTEIDNQPFGAFWFQIKSVKFRDVEILVTLKCLRHISEAFIEIEPILTGAVKTRSSLENSSQQRPATSVQSLNEIYSDFVDTLKSFLSISNVKEFITFLFAFVIAIFTGSTAFINFLGNFILALLREMSFLVKNSTPIFLGVLDFFAKIIGGFYILLALMFKQSTPRRPPPVTEEEMRLQYRDHKAWSNDHPRFNQHFVGQFD
ncbi:unnamed protein product [Chrysodeixis includens]|uniref:Uncharacterized protein n=1 Tax=Chrysodeixis includens TaxID=689277 RepID=A0A9N8PZA8_CHRIL|nr:unnamed protein product [Chrysodeixis includens]